LENIILLGMKALQSQKKRSFKESASSQGFQSLSDNFVSEETLPDDIVKRILVDADLIEEPSPNYTN
jgi:hypothetical protein